VNILIFSNADRLDAKRIRVKGNRLQHLKEILQIQVGQSLRVGELNGLCGQGTVLQLDDSQALLSIELSEPPPPKLALTLVLALPRPKMLRRILRTVGEVGVSDLHLINSYRVEKSYWKTPALKSDTIQEYFIAGLEQARDTTLPNLYLHSRFKPFVEDTLPGLLADQQGFAAHPGDYPDCPRGSNEHVLLAIGPEGGFIPYEVEKLQQAGCEIVSLGERIMRVETAVTHIIGRLF
jgi:RsmE family RNA methyltransferase